MPPQPPLAAIRAIMRARDVLHRAGDALMPAEMVLLEQSFGIARTQVIGAVAELGVADLLSGGPRTAEQLAAALDVDADALHRVLRGAAAFGLLRRPRHVHGGSGSPSIPTRRPASRAGCGG